jgi:hypothetical protein
MLALSCGGTAKGCEMKTQIWLDEYALEWLAPPESFRLAPFSALDFLNYWRSQPRKRAD